MSLWWNPTFWLDPRNDCCVGEAIRFIWWSAVQRGVYRRRSSFPRPLSAAAVVAELRLGHLSRGDRAHSVRVRIDRSGQRRQTGEGRRGSQLGASHAAGSYARQRAADGVRPWGTETAGTDAGRCCHWTSKKLFCSELVANEHPCLSEDSRNLQQHFPNRTYSLPGSYPSSTIDHPTRQISPALKAKIWKLALTRSPDPNRSISSNFVHVNSRSLYTVDKQIVVVEEGMSYTM